MLQRSTQGVQRLFHVARCTAHASAFLLHNGLPDEDDACSTSSTRDTIASSNRSCRSSNESSSHASHTGLPFSLQPVRRLHIWGFGGGAGKSTAAPVPEDAAVFTDSFTSSQSSAQSSDPYSTDSFTHAAPGPDAPASFPVTADASAATAFPLAEDSVEVASAIADSLGAVELSSIAAAKALAWTNASLAISGLTTVHETLGLPWWASIVVFNLSLRLLTFPLMVLSQKASIKLMGMNQKMASVKHIHAMAVKATSQAEHARLIGAAHVEYEKQFKDTGSPFVTMLQLPAVMLLNGLIFISIYWGVTDLMRANVPSLTTGGMLWFTDLTVPDSTFALGIMCAALTYGMVHNSMAVGGDMNMATSKEQVEQLALIKRVMLGCSLMFLPMSYYVSAGTAMLWVSNSSFMVAQGLTLRNASFRKLVGLPSLQEMRQMQADALKAAPAAPAPGTPPGGSPGGTPPAAAPAAAPATPVLLRAPPPGTSKRR